MGEGRLLATTTAMLAQAVFAQGRYAEAGDLCRETADAAAPDDIITQVIWRAVMAKLLAREGRCEEAVTLARRAVMLIASTDLISHRADAMLDLAEVLWTCSGPDASIGTIRTAVSLYEQKGNVVGADRARALLNRGPRRRR
jgi:ATP/maltotriose-dependent transcriptional regulator MalT